ncbi:MFS transporter [Streptomyces sp. NPDC008092]|uniref:MFS transporter n=1 Tax=Streptomyces sp. NPDC008092 TaxID=3364808 RepID=UPI0036E41858
MSEPITQPVNTVVQDAALPRRLAWELSLLLPATAGMFSVFQGMQAVLLPQQVADIDPGDKVNMLAVLAAAGALLAAIANPLAGALSDRTRTRFGHRAPWLLVTAVLAALALLLLAGQQSYFLLGAVYCLVMLVMGSYQAVISAIVPDRIPAERRGTASAVVGVATPIGVLYGVNMVSKVTTSPLAGYAVLGGTLVLFALVFVLFTRDTPRPPGAGRRRSGSALTALKLFFSSFRSRDFAWAFTARMILMFGYWSVSSYLLYTLQDYIRADTIPGHDAVSAVGTLTTINMGCLLAGTIVSGWLSDRIARRKILVILSSALAGIALVVPLVAPTWTGMIVFEVVFGFAFGAYLSVDAALMTLVLPGDSDNARDLGILNVATTGPQVLSQFIGALVINSLGGYGSLFVFAIGCAALGAVAIVPIRSVR